jgi:hypothetical protein
VVSFLNFWSIGFVSNKKLTALSQYESGVFFKKLVPKKKMIEKEIVQFFEKEVKDNIALSSYVIDFCIVDGKVMIVDLNPFHANTGGGLFTWREDRNLILNGYISSKRKTFSVILVISIHFCVFF